MEHVLLIYQLHSCLKIIYPDIIIFFKSQEWKLSKIYLLLKNQGGVQGKYTAFSAVIIIVI